MEPPRDRRHANHAAPGRSRAAPARRPGDRPGRGACHWHRRSEDARADRLGERAAQRGRVPCAGARRDRCVALPRPEPEERHPGLRIIRRPRHRDTDRPLGQERPRFPSLVLRRLPGLAIARRAARGALQRQGLWLDARACRGARLRGQPDRRQARRQDAGAGEEGGSEEGCPLRARACGAASRGKADDSPAGRREAAGREEARGRKAGVAATDRGFAASDEEDCAPQTSRVSPASHCGQASATGQNREAGYRQVARATGRAPAEEPGRQPAAQARPAACLRRLAHRQRRRCGRGDALPPGRRRQDCHRRERDRGLPALGSFGGLFAAFEAPLHDEADAHHHQRHDAQPSGVDKRLCQELKSTLCTVRAPARRSPSRRRCPAAGVRRACRAPVAQRRCRW